MTNWAARLFARAVDRRLRSLGVSSGHMPVFFALGNGAALSQKALTRAAAIEQPTMAATLARMERDGLVAREPDPADGRGALFRLTPAALEKAAKVMAVAGEVNARALDTLTPRERETYLVLLAKVIAGLERDQATPGMPLGDR